MALTCPRCSTDVPEGAHYCPYCNLPKPSRGFTAQVEAELVCSSSGASSVTSPPREIEKRPLKRPKKPTRKRSFKMPAIGGLVALLCLGAYIFVVPLVYSDVAEPKAILVALDNLRRMPSNEEGLTIDARMLRELERSRRGGNLAGYQGWIVKSIKGTKSKVLLVFSYDEVGNAHRRAEWLADLAQNTFAPQNELAVSVSR